MPSRLNVTPVPFRSSRLAVPPSPFSPQYPITPSAPPARTHTPKPQKELIKQLPPPAREPMRWLWVCHSCHYVYPLTVTRRCLRDGHYFCAGTSTFHSRRDSNGIRRVRKHPACGSEFDYAGWKDWGVWRRNLLLLSSHHGNENCDSIFEEDSEDEMMEVDEITNTVVSPITPTTFTPTPSFLTKTQPSPQKKNCWTHCDYPSECRWGKQFGVATPLQPFFPLLQPQTAEFIDVEMADAPVPKTDFADILTPEQQAVVAETVDGIETSMSPALSDLTDLVTRAQKRREREEIPVSPLAIAVEQGSQGTKRVTRSSSRESLKRAVEDGFDVLRGFVGALRSFSAPPSEGRGDGEEERWGRRKSLG